MLSNRANKTIWDQTHSEDLETVYEEYLHNEELTDSFNNNSDLSITSYFEEHSGFEDNNNEETKKQM